MMQFDIQIVHSVDEIDQEAWDRLSGGRPFSSHCWYRYGEKVLSAYYPIYIILSIQAEPIARGTFWLSKQEPMPRMSTVVDYFGKFLMSRWPLLMCRAPLVDVSGLILPESSLKEEAFKTIAQIAQNEARRHNASLIIFDHLEKLESEWITGQSKDYSTYKFSHPGTCLNICWPTFDDYLKFLGQKKRKEYRRHCRLADEWGIEIKCHAKPPDPSDPIIDRVLVLTENVCQHHNSPSSPWDRAMLENASLVPATWVTAEKDGQLVGCGILLGDGDYRLFRLIGLDYSVKFAYFQIFYERIRCAIEQGAKAIWGGGGLYEFKQHIGFTLMDRNYTTWTATNKNIQRLINFLLKATA